tara:strand:- start:488 stop:700 length:213 start_codon:yes stop_codon:yes gene_type:complete
METQGIIIAHPKTEEDVNTLKVVMQALKIRFEISKENAYDPRFVAKVIEGRQQVKEGKTVKMELSSVWKE